MMLTRFSLRKNTIIVFQEVYKNSIAVLVWHCAIGRAAGPILSGLGPLKENMRLHLWPLAFPMPLTGSRSQCGGLGDPQRN